MINKTSSFFTRFWNTHPDHHSVAKGMAWVFLFVLFGSLTRAAKEIAIAYRYGVSAEVDAYLFVFNLLNWPISISFSVLTVVLVPLVARIRHESSTEVPRFRAELFGLSIMLGVGLAFLAWFGLPPLLRSAWTGLPVDTVKIASKMVPAMFFLSPLGILISLFSAWMLSAGRHANTLLECVPAFVILIAVMAFRGGGIEPLVFATLAGFVFHLISLAVPLYRRGEIELPQFARNSPKWAEFWKGFGIMLAGQFLMSFIGIIDQFFASHVGTGAIATLSYANRIMALILGFGATVVNRATLPVFSRIQSQIGGQPKRLATHWARILFVIGFVVMVTTWWMAPWLVKMLFERGAFSPRDSLSVTQILRFGLVQLPFYFSGIVIVSYLSSRGFYYWLFWSGVLGLCSKLIGNAILVPIYGVGGIAFSTSFAYVVNFIFFLFVFRRTQDCV